MICSPKDKTLTGILYLAAMKTVTFLAALFCAALLQAQSFNSPESVEYDVAGSRWIAGQNGSGIVNILSPASNTLAPFAANIASGPHGIEVVGDTVFVCDGPRIKGYNRITGSPVINQNLGATFLNGITSDGGDNLFITDFAAKKIYRFNRQTLAFNVMVTGLVKSPNGIYYDGAANRCVFVNWGSSATIMAMSLSDSSTTTLVTTTLSNIDGITRDFAGNWYVTAWGNQSLMMFDPAFANAPVAVMTGLSNPADIDINAAGDSIGIPNSGTANNVVFYTVSTTTGLTPLVNAMRLSVFPNPATDVIKVQWTYSNVQRIVIFRETGQCYVWDEYYMTRFTNNTREAEFACGLWMRGMYIIALFDDKGQPLASKTVIVD
jgi:streptogramin lyase